MKTKLIFCFLFFAGYINAQLEWTKDDRNNLYNDYLSLLTNYRNLTPEQKESIALCCLDGTTAKYAKKDFVSKIEIEIKRIHEAQVTQCAKNIGVELGASVSQPTEIVATHSEEWTKLDKEQLSKDFLSYLSRYSHLTEEQLELFELCYINETTTQYTKTQFNQLITLEVKQHKEVVSQRCASTHKISLTAPKIDESKLLPTKEFLIGTWKTDHGTTIIFNADGSFAKTFTNNFVTSNYSYVKDLVTTGDWFLDEKGNVTMNENWTEEHVKLLKSVFTNYHSTSTFIIISHTKDFFKMELVEGNSCCTEANTTRKMYTQANRVQ